MIKILKKQLAATRRHFLLKKCFEPEKNFLDNVKLSFLSGLHEKTKDYKKDKQAVIFNGYGFWRKKTFFRYAVPSAFIALFLGAGVMVLERNNILPGNLFYQVKRLGESIQIQIAGKQQKPFLYDEFAKRRLEEIKNKKTESPKDANLTSLDEDLYYEISSAALGACDPELSEAETKNLCGSLSGLIDEYEKISGNEYENLDGLINVCETFSNASDYENP
jgi:hypothetical protein